MIWLDVELLCSRTWYSDPIDAMVKQNLTLIWESFKGTIESEISRNKTRSTYGEELYWNDLADSHMNPKINCKDESM